MGALASAIKICPECKVEYAGGEVFCPVDAARLVSGTDFNFDALDPNDPMIGVLLADRYQILERIGEGGMGLIYKAKHVGIDRMVAVKVLREDLTKRTEVVERFQQEAKSASKIGHDNIVSVTDFGQTGTGAIYFVMEHLDGEDLATVLNRERTVSLERTVRILVQCCYALGAAHAKHIVHRDMKPENIFLTTREEEEDFVKIVDFGIAKMSDVEIDGVEGRKLTKTGMIFGTPEYMSPEQAGGKQLDHRVDIYALGVILYECFTGQTPFVGDSFMGILTQHLFEDPPPMETVDPDCYVPAEMQLVVYKALAKDPDERYQNMDELATAIEYAAAGELSEETRAWSLGKRSSRGKIKWASTLLLLGILAAGAWLFQFYKDNQAQDSTGRSAVYSAPRVDPAPIVEPARSTQESADGGSRDLPAVELSKTVLLSVDTLPTGAKLIREGVGVICERTPCEFEVDRGAKVVLQAKLGAYKGGATFTPKREMAVQIALMRPPPAKVRPKKGTRPNAAGARTPTKAKKKRPTDLKVPDIFQ